MRSFIGVVRAFSRCFPKYSNFLTDLEDLVAGKECSNKISWTDKLLTAFSNVHNMLKSLKVLTLPNLNDQLVLVSDFSVPR